MDIGTGKLPINTNVEIEKKENHWIIDGIEVWGYDLTTPNQYFSAYDYAKFAISKINELTKKNIPIFLVGGTGFYTDTVTGKKILAGEKPNKHLRESLNTTPTKNLLTWLQQLNKDAFEKVDKNNRHRIIRALEIELGKEKQLGKNVLPKLQTTDFKFIGLNTDRKMLYNRADIWLEEVWKNGLVEETQKLSKNYPASEKLNGLVYKETLAFINNILKEDEAIQKAKYSLHAYIRRQLTWFRKNKDIHWIDIKKSNFKEEAKKYLLN